MATVLVPLPDRDFDTTEVAVPWKLLKDSGHDVVFATERGDRKPECDPLRCWSETEFVPSGADREKEDAVHYTFQMSGEAHADVGEVSFGESGEEAEQE